MKSGRRSLREDLHLSSHRAFKFASVRCASTRSDASRGSIIRKEILQFRQSQQGLLEVVEAELEKRRLFHNCARFLKHLGGRTADDGNTDLSDTGTEKLGGYTRHIRSHVYNRGILQTCAIRCKFG